MAERLGIQKRVHGIHTDELGVLVPFEGDMFDDVGLFEDEVDDREIIDFDIIVETQNSVSVLDERISIDVWATFPVSSKVAVVDGEEEHEFILCRFPLSETKYFRTVYTNNTEGATGKTTLAEGFIAGLHDLTGGNPDYESNHFLNGDIRSVNLQLYTRYKEEGKFKRVKTDMTDGLWSITLQFSKKI